MDEVLVATIRWMGLNCYRFMMVLCALRYQGNGQVYYMGVCREEDFNTALGIIRVLFRHSIHAFHWLPNKKEPTQKKNLVVPFSKIFPFILILPNTSRSAGS